MVSSRTGHRTKTCRGARARHASIPRGVAALLRLHSSPVDAARRIFGRARGRVSDAREQAPRLRMPYMVAPLQSRSRLLLLHQLRELGVQDGRRYLPELTADGIPQHLDAAVAEYCELLPGNAPGPGGINPAAGALLYGLVRGLRPSVVIETGT